mgnify:CR=1 FL=1
MSLIYNTYYIIYNACILLYDWVLIACVLFTFSFYFVLGGVHAVQVMDFQRHAGGWGGGYSSFSNATFDLPDDLSSYDTLEVYHEHACFERKNLSLIHI